MKHNMRDVDAKLPVSSIMLILWIMRKLTNQAHKQKRQLWPEYEISALEWESILFFILMVDSLCLK